jgi:protein TonB
MIIRYFISASAAFFISISLFWLMQRMILAEQSDLSGKKQYEIADFIRIKKQERVRTKDRAREKRAPKPKKALQKPRLRVQQTKQPVHEPEIINIPRIDVPLNLTDTATLGDAMVAPLKETYNQGAQISMNLIPLVRIPPLYPQRAKQANQEGYVKLLFTITRQGLVRNVKVVDAEPEGLFDRAAVNAIRKWKFKPRIIDNTPVEREAIQIISFQLNK